MKEHDTVEYRGKRATIVKKLSPGLFEIEIANNKGATIKVNAVKSSDLKIIKSYSPDA